MSFAFEISGISEQVSYLPGFGGQEFFIIAGAA